MYCRCEHRDYKSKCAVCIVDYKSKCAVCIVDYKSKCTVCIVDVNTWIIRVSVLCLYCKCSTAGWWGWRQGRNESKNEQLVQFPSVTCSSRAPAEGGTAVGSRRRPQLCSPGGVCVYWQFTSGSPPPPPQALWAFFHCLFYLFHRCHRGAETFVQCILGLVIPKRAAHLFPQITFRHPLHCIYKQMCLLSF